MGVGESDTKDSSLSTRVAASEDTELRDRSLLRKRDVEPMSDDDLLSCVGGSVLRRLKMTDKLPIHVPAQICSSLSPLF